MSEIITNFWVWDKGKEYISVKDDEVYIKGQLQPKQDGVTVRTQLETYIEEFYQQLFSQYFENLIVLAAAGTSMDNGKNTGKCRGELWEECKSELEKIASKIGKIKDLPFWKNKDLEDALSYVETYNALGIEDISDSIKNIKSQIRKNCNLELDEEAPHKEFLYKITKRRINSNRVQIFTTNYDTLFEQAASEIGIIVIDGFSFSHPRKFSGRYFDIDIVNREKTRIKNEDNFIPNVIHLYKLHGSLDWKQEGKNVIQTIENEMEEDSLIIYPASDKFKSSYEPPFFEMMSRFQQALRKDNALLLILGFGFQDMHIQNVIIEAVKQNPSLHLVILDYNENEAINIDKYKTLFNGTLSKVTIIFGKFVDFTKMYPLNKTYQGDEDEKDF